MKKLLEAIQQNLQETLLEKVKLFSDIDTDGNINTNLQAKSLNKNVENEYIEARKNMKAKLVTYLLEGKEEFVKEINNPKNFKKYKGLIPVNNKKQLINLLEEGIELFGNDGNFNWIDTSNITDMSGLFVGFSDFNGHIELWDVSNVTDMSQMFAGDEVYNSKFNQPIGDWNVSHVTNMCEMFSESLFNQDISNWNVSNVDVFAGMFYNAYKFNQPIDNWDVSNAADMSGMFYGAMQFNQNISKWHIKNNTETFSMFTDCPIKDEYKPNKENIL